MRRILCCIAAAIGSTLILGMPITARAQQQAGMPTALQQQLDTYRAQSGFPGAVLAVAFADGRVVTVASGQSDTARRMPMRTDHRLLMGSVGKTYVAAVALQLLREGRLDLDAPVARYVGGQGWFDSVANAPVITVRQIMTHSSGVVRYEFRPDFTEALTRDPSRVWDPRDQVRYLHGATPPFAPGAGWEYSDTNYLILALVLEAITKRPIDEEIAQRLLGPYQLQATIPSDSRRLPGVSQGYAGAQNPFGGRDAMFDADGLMIVNPQFEGAGGGYAATAADAARWGATFFSGRAFGESLLPVATTGPAARLGPGTRYGLGMILRDSTVAGPMRGHSGFFPGYLTELRHYPASGVTVALLVNASNVRATPPMARWVDELVAGLNQRNDSGNQ
ncbi:MAG: beta-lactamase family protein [Gemmatimonadaceae bacterium]|nr:beta-lactamase family protein [Gemmatimonadaceae bacterium]